MKKYLSFLMCFAMISFVACDDKPTDGEGPDGPGTPPEGTKLVEKISCVAEEEHEGDVYNWNSDYLITYDSQNRIIKVELKEEDSEDGEYAYFTISYGTDKVTVIYKDAWWSGGDNEPEINEEGTARKRFLNVPRTAENSVITRAEGDRVLRETTGTYTYNLTSDGYLSTGTEEHQSVDENDVEFYSRSGASTFTYNNAYISKYVSVDEWIETSDDSGIDTGTFSYTYTNKYNYTWSNGNLTKIVEEYRVEDSSEYPTDPSEWQYNISYGTKTNPEKVNIDMNSFTFPTQVGDNMLSAFGFCGKKSKNLVSSCTEIAPYYDEGTTNYTWETDSNGYVTKVSIDAESEYYSAKSTYTVTYKN